MSDTPIDEQPKILPPDLGDHDDVPCGGFGWTIAQACSQIDDG
jgi:hypothetical protein